MPLNCQMRMPCDGAEEHKCQTGHWNKNSLVRMRRGRKQFHIDTPDIETERRVGGDRRQRENKERLLEREKELEREKRLEREEK